MREAAFDKSKMDAYAKEAVQRWGNTDAYRECQEKTRGKIEAEFQYYGKDMMCFIAEFTSLIGKDPASEQAQVAVWKLQQFITEHFYTCTKPILNSLGMMYVSDERFRRNIDGSCGEGTAAFAAEAIAVFCRE